MNIESRHSCDRLIGQVISGGKNQATNDNPTH